MGVIDGGPNSGTRYGYFSNYAKFVNIDLASNSPVCLGEELIISAETINDATYTWTGPNTFVSNEQSPVISEVELADAGTYTLQVSLEECESDPIEIEVSIFDLPEVTVSADPTLIEDLVDIQLNADSDPENTYSWSPPGLVSNPSIANPTVSDLLVPTTFTVEVTDENGCRMIDSILIEVSDEICREPYVFVPNAFSPNDDGLNDEFRVAGQLTDSYYIVIYDRWGNEVFESTDQQQAWDGKVDGKIMSGDAFGYTLQVTCIGGYSFTKQGSITILQ